MVTDGVDGYRYPPGDADALARILGTVEVAPAGALAAMGAAARATHRRRFATGDNVATLETVYRYATEHPRGGMYHGADSALSSPDHVPAG